MPHAMAPALAGRLRGLRPRRPAGGIIGPVAVETDDAPFHALTGADHAAVLHDRIIDPMPLAVGNQDRGGAEPSWNRARGPRLPSDLLDFLEPHDCKGRIPEPAFLGGKSRHDLVERSALIAQRHIAVVSRTRQPEILFEPACGARRRDRAGDGGYCQNDWKDASAHHGLLGPLERTTVPRDDLRVKRRLYRNFPSLGSPPVTGR